MTQKIHELKTDPAPFQAVWQGDKTHEIRYDDRNFQVDDLLVLKETVKPFDKTDQMRDLGLTGRMSTHRITHVQKGYGLLPGWCVLSLGKAE